MSYSIFISYRREDSSTAVSALLKDLQHEFGANAVFADKASISTGDAWPDTIKEALHESKIVLVVISDNWLCKEKDNPNQLRFCTATDWVRQEIEMAQQLNKTIIPVLAGVSKIPDHPDLPASISSLKDIQFRKIDFQPGDIETIKPFLKDLGKKIENLSSPDEFKVKLEKNIVEKYQVKEILGTGSRANIYLGWDNGIEREVAIKVNTNLDYKDDFISTLKLAAKINDNAPNCISILGAYVKKEPYHVILPFFKNGSLRKMIKSREGKAFSIGDIIKILLEIGNGLSQMHLLNHTHLNVKPSNIILDNQLDAYINLLCIVSTLNRSAIIEKLTALSINAASAVYREELCYLPPELFDDSPGEDESTANRKIDQYMLGLIGYELMTGAIPNTVNDLKDLLERGRGAFKKLPLLNDIRKDCPDKFSKILHRMIERDPGNRYDNLAEALQEINRVSFDVFEIAKNSFSRCISADDAGNGFFKAFYTILLKKLPPKQADKFKGKGIGETNSNRQYGILRDAIFMLFLFGQNNLGEREPNILTRIAEMHNGDNYNIPPKSYTLFLEVLVGTVCGFFQDEIPEPFDPQCKISENERDRISKAWVAAMKPGIEYMKNKYE